MRHLASESHKDSKNHLRARLLLDEEETSSNAITAIKENKSCRIDWYRWHRREHTEFGCTSHDHGVYK